MKTVKIAFILGILALLASCSKEKFPRVEYEVSSTSSTNIAYTMVTPTIRTDNISGHWSTSFKHSQGASVFLSATHSGFGLTQISVYVNKELIWSASTSIPGETIQIFEVLP